MSQEGQDGRSSARNRAQGRLVQPNMIPNGIPIAPVAAQPGGVPYNINYQGYPAPMSVPQQQVAAQFSGQQYAQRFYSPRQGQVWTPPAASSSAVSNSPKLRERKKKASKAIQIIDPSTKEEIKTAAGKGGVASTTDGDNDSGNATATVATSTPSESATDVVKSQSDHAKVSGSDVPPGSITPNSRRRHKLLITNPTDGTVVNEDSTISGTTDAKSAATVEPRSASTEIQTDAGKPAVSDSAESAESATNAKVTAEQQENAVSVPNHKPTIDMKYAEGQWSPSRPDGKRAYSMHFVTKLRPCAAKPDDFNSDLTTKIETACQQSSQSKGGRNTAAGGSLSMQPSWGADKKPIARGSGDMRQNQLGRGSGGRAPRTIQISARQQSTLNKSENRFVPSVQKGAGIKGDKSVLEAVQMALNKLTLEKFDKLSKQLVELMLSDLNQLDKVTEMIFSKAVDEPFFCIVYSRLCRSLHDMAVEKNCETTQESGGETIAVSKKFKALLLNNCQKQFQKAEHDAMVEREAEAEAQKKAEDPAERERISKLPRAEREKHEFDLREAKRDAILRVAKVRRHIIGNITFIGELYLVDMVTEPIMRYCIDNLLTTAQSEIETKEHREESLEQLCKLLETAGAKLERKYKKKAKGKSAELSAMWDDYFKKLDTITKQKGLASRIKFAIQDVIDMRQQGWMQRSGKQKGPKTIDEIHAEANAEAVAEQMATERHNQRAGSQRPAARRPPPQPQRTEEQWMAQQRKNTKVNVSMFGSLGGKPAASIRLGSGPRLGKRTLGRPGVNAATRANQFSVLRDDPQMEKKPIVSSGENESVAVVDTTEAETAESTTAAEDGEPKFPPDELARKINGALIEYFSIRVIEEVKQSLDDWGRVTAVYTAFCTDAFRKLEGLKADDRRYLADLMKQLVGASGGIPVKPFVSALEAFCEELPDIVCDAPKLPDYVGEIIAAAMIAEPTASQAMELLASEPIRELLFGDLPLKVALGAYTAIKSWDGEAKAAAVYAASGVPLNNFIPGDDARVAELVARADLEFLLRPPSDSGIDLAAVSTAVEKLVQDDASYDQVRAEVDKLTALQRTDPNTIQAIVRAIINGVTSKTTLAAGTSVREPTAEDEAKETALLDRYKDVLVFIADGADAQFAVVCAVAHFTADKNFPRGMVNRLFEYLYDKDVVFEETYVTFKDDKALDERMPKKTVAVQQAESFYSRLAQDD